MSFIFCDSFDHYAIADIERKWSKIIPGPGSGGAQPVRTITLEEGRRSTDALKLFVSMGATTSGGSQSLRQVFAAESTLIFGFAFKQTWSGSLSATTNSTSTNNIWRLDSLGDTQLWARLNLDNTISILRGNTASTVLGTTSFALNDSLYFYLEFKIVIHNTTGSVEVRRDGMTILSLTNIDTLHVDATVNSLVLGNPSVGNSSSAAFWYDDFYLLNGSGSTSNDFLNDVRIDAMYPNAEGNTIQWTPSTGTDNSALVDEAEFNGDTDYNSTGVVNNKDTLAFPNAPVSGAEYKAVQINMMCRKEDSGPAAVKAVIRLGGVDYLGAERGVAIDYRDAFEIFDRTPDDAGVWTSGDIDGAEFGYQKST